MQDLVRARTSPFLAAGVVIVVVTVAVLRLPDSFVSQVENVGLFTISQRGWVFRLLAFFAILQAFYVGFAVLRPERLKRARETQPRIGRMSRPALVRSLARTAAGSICLTIIYGIAAFSATGYQSGFWLFSALAASQVAWYFRETGQVARWLAFQPETLERRGPTAWVSTPAGYCPPIARGLQPIEVRSPGAE